MKSIINDNETYKNHGVKTGIKTWDDMSDSNKQMAENMYQRTNKTLKNFTKTMARSSQQQLHIALDTAFTEILLGYKSYDKAIADAIKKVSKKGTMVVYNSGYKDTLETWNLDKLCIDEEKKDDIINGIKIPKEIYDISGISKGVVDEIKEGLRKLTNEYNIKLDKLTVRELEADEQNVPFQFCANTRGIYFEYELVVNKDIILMAL